MELHHVFLEVTARSCAKDVMVVVLAGPVPGLSDCLVVYPIVYWTQRRHAKKPLEGIDAQLVFAQICIFIGYSYVNLSLLGGETSTKW